ncbi:ACT domain-containing protein ACR10 [Forsythia ovata]|uniref:ACT domain-containing protein ACR n=1 Tax=Forsythia ovata TaxID=205694 RepID=A0ABD1T626_9LAMI
MDHTWTVVGVGGSPRGPSSEIPGEEDQVGPCEQLDALSPFNPLSEMRQKKRKENPWTDPIISTPDLLHTTKRREETIKRLKLVFGDAMISCEIELADPEVTARLQSFLPSSIPEDTFRLELPGQHSNGVLTNESVSVVMDNSLIPSHTLVQIFCQDHKGLIYDIMRTLKDYNIQIAYGSFLQT